MQPSELVQNIEFDDVEMVTAGAFADDLTVRWVLRGEVVRELRITADDVMSRRAMVCPACLVWRGWLVEMSGRRALTYPDRPGETFTHAECPVCLGMDFGMSVPPARACFCGKLGHDPRCLMAGGKGPGAECVCGESPHRIRCPMGFENYFQFSPSRAER